MTLPKLTLIGAGPGDPELITLKGARALAKADVVLYDALVNPLLLDYAPVDIPKYFVGKRKAQHSFTQDQINDLIVEMAKSHGNVVRLKGGDPFVFGRGYEELLVAHENGLQVEFIPGISSSISVPGLSGIPVTHRGSSESFWVLTATNANQDLSNDLKLAAQSNATLVILMGLSKLPEIVKVLAQTKALSHPFAVIQNGSLPNQRQVTGTLANIQQLVGDQQFGAPAIIVVGEVLKLQNLVNNAHVTAYVNPT